MRYATASALIGCVTEMGFMIDAVVVTADSREMVLECLDHLRSPLLEGVVVVDNGSTDGTAEAVAQRHPEARLIRLEESRGLAEPYNVGASMGSAGLVLFLNDDVLADDGAIEKLEAALRSGPSAVAAAGRMVDPCSGKTQVEYQPRRFPSTMRFLAAFAGLEHIWRNNPWSGSHRRHPLADDQVVSVEQPPGSCLLVRRRVFEQVGGWDEQFEFWFEDVDLARRLRAHGDVLYVPMASFRHVGGHSARRLSQAEIVRRSYRGALRYADKHFNRPQQVATGALFLIASGTRGLLLRRANRELAGAHRRVAAEAIALLIGKRNAPR
jgi:N-acetylglucosaminyl-diphospho-decaprenol L-rhamnosyltransferase